MRHWIIALVLTALLSVPAPALAGATPPVPPWRAPELGDHPLAGKIFLPGENRMISASQLIGAMAGARFVLLGEKHDNPDHHALQAWLVERLIAGGRKTAVAFEMFGTDRAPAIAKHLARKPKDAGGLGAATGWESSGWPDWALYRPIAQAALDAGLPVVAANLPDAEAKSMARRHPVEPERVSELGLDQPLASELYNGLVQDIRDSHCNMLPDKAISPMVMTQRAKDGSMARTMIKAAAARGMDGAVLIAGTGHVRKDRGIPVMLERMAPEAAVFTVGFLEVAPNQNDPAAHAGADGYPFDAVWFTPRVGGSDPCEELGRHLKKSDRGKDKK